MNNAPGGSTMLGVTTEPSDTTRTASRSNHSPDGEFIDATAEDTSTAPIDDGTTGPEDEDASASTSRSVAILPVARPQTEDPGPHDPRRSDVDEWGRSEHMRSVVRRLYDPMYRYWFRVEWEGLEKIPLHGGAFTAIAGSATGAPGTVVLEVYNLPTNF